MEDKMEGKIFNARYKIVKLIGKGGTAIVYQADDVRLKRKVAIKILKEEFKNNKIFIERFKNEALSVARLISPNIVPIYDVGEENDVNYIVMEYVDQTSLKDYILNNKMSEKEILKMALEICSGLIHAHKHKIIHRDIKPHNILINSEGTYKLTDFGIAKLDADTNLTQTGNIMGSIAYFSPEQAKGCKADERSDIYSFGVTLYEASTGKLPFDGDNYLSIAYKHVHESPVEPKEINNNISNELNDLILKAMEKEQGKRFQSAEKMFECLSDIVNRRTMSYQNLMNGSLNKDETLLFVPEDDMKKIYPNSEAANINLDKKLDNNSWKNEQNKWIGNGDNLSEQEDNDLTKKTKNDKSIGGLLRSKNKEIFKAAFIIVGLIMAIVIMNLFPKNILTGSGDKNPDETTKVSKQDVDNKKNTHDNKKSNNKTQLETTPTDKDSETAKTKKPTAKTPKKTQERNKADKTITTTPTPTTTPENTSNITIDPNDPLSTYVPNLVGKSSQEAEGILQAGQYRYRIEHVPTDNEPVGIIYKTIPGAGTPYRIGEGQTITVFFNPGN